MSGLLRRLAGARIFLCFQKDSRRVSLAGMTSYGKNEAMKKYDVIVIGSGAGASIVESALAHDLSVALVDKGPLGGTCLNLGCIPSKMLVYPADRIVEIEQAKKLGIHAEIRKIAFRPS